jgi:putative transposase
MMVRQIEDLGVTIGRRRACSVLGCAPASWYRWRKPLDVDAAVPSASQPHGSQPRALSELEQQRVLHALTEPRFCDLSPAAVHAALLDEGTYIGSISTFYRVLRANVQVRERRRIATHPPTVKPELIATRPNQVWSWDITRLAGPMKWTWFYLYVILDIFSRYVVGWKLARRETAAIAETLIREALARESVVPGQLTIHADRGSAMTSKTIAELYADLGVTKSFSRPHVSNDNPYSEAQFKTMKYRPEFPPRFGTFAEGSAFCTDFFTWYNEHHYHSGIALLTPAAVHHGRAAAILEKRQAVLTEAYQLHPERFVRKPPQPLQLATTTYINPPECDSLIS